MLSREQQVEAVIRELREIVDYLWCTMDGSQTLRVPSTARHIEGLADGLEIAQRESVDAVSSPWAPVEEGS